MKRRDFFKYGAALAASVRGQHAAAGAAPAEFTAAAPAPARLSRRPSGSTVQPARALRAEYIVVGSGAGGGTVAARLAEAGYTVLVLEAGGNPATIAGGDPLQRDANTFPEDYEVPAFHGLATENDAIKWDFFVRHYEDPSQQQRDDKYVADYHGKPVDGIWYPRAGALGGCTAHNAMIFVYPDNADWNAIADLTGDPSWRAERMRAYLERMENCQHRSVQRLFNRLGRNPTRHGWNGWLSTEKHQAIDALVDGQIRKALLDAVRQRINEPGLPSLARVASVDDPNDWRRVDASEEGPCYTPMTTRGHLRMGTRERLLEVQRRYPNRLTIETGALVTQVLFDGNRAVGVEFQKGDHLYRADPRAADADGERFSASATREVILAGGAFNTPQLLMLSGIGPAEHLRAHGIGVRVPLCNVGRNLQDRYEVAIVNRTVKDWEVLEGATFSKADPQYAKWAAARRGIYTTNGTLSSLVARSSPWQPVPDLFCYALLTDFRGYRPTFTTRLRPPHHWLTWVVLKGHTNNTGGTVTLRSNDPRDTPHINFRYFDEGTDASADDLRAVVAGVQLVRRLTASLKGRVVDREEYPGPGYETDEALRQFVRDQAWGHHASCTCAIGPRERGGVLSSDFKVHGTTALRVVDASVFPRVPGLFIVSAVYMVGEKAADVIIAAAKQQPA
jgi:choline dehydrogenase-like flavoprotein